jgi:hypothetical protein
VCGVLCPGTHLAIGEGDIHAPVQLVLDAPVRTYGLGQALGIGRQLLI